MKAKDGFPDFLISKGLYSLGVVFAIIASLITILSVTPIELAISAIMVIVLSVFSGCVYLYCRNKVRLAFKDGKLAQARANRLEDENERFQSRVTQLTADCERFAGESGGFIAELESLRSQLTETQERNRLADEELKKARKDFEALSEEYERALEERKGLLENRQLETEKINIKQEELRLEREKLKAAETSRIEDRKAGLGPIFNARMVARTKNDIRVRDVIIVNLGKGIAKEVSLSVKWRKKKLAKRIAFKRNYYEFVWAAGEERVYRAGSVTEMGTEYKFCTLSISYQNLYGDKDKSSFSWSLD